jgi:hypothetical protein
MTSDDRNADAVLDFLVATRERGSPVATAVRQVPGRAPPTSADRRAAAVPDR